MKKTLTTAEIHQLHTLLAAARYQKLPDADKVRLWRIARQLRAIATTYEEDSRDAAQRMKPTDDFDTQLAAAQRYEQHRKNPDTPAPAEDDTMTDEQYQEFLRLFRQYNDTVGKALEELSKKEHELGFEPLGEDAFAQLMASNDWTLAQATALGDFLTEQ